ncbi:sialate O-acetylesterase [Mucilaginibacter robiniae]|uniref:Sialate O-acetylesterase n=1 Tax=Mucilaginibacter robiniae TaxID=2728022 RepID=A0A7L5E4G8_9SPHI|nr:sialate O-acetylesterase [Mucilaginibacter robiniae]QJD96604.1 sialate O-acetylesterase [Mucilaginibacter robiniae]
MKIAKSAAACLLLFSCLKTYSQVRLPQLISDGMVLQRDAKINVWGWASSAEKVTVKFNNKSYKATTHSDGKWMLQLSPTKAGGPYTMQIDASNHITLSNILVGDVWFCSGQSNMVTPMERVKEKYPEEITGAHYPQIRNFFVPTVSDVSKIHADLPPGKWTEANPKDILNFGATSYFMAKQLYLKYHIPIGIINSSVGGTPIQAWMSAEGFTGMPQYMNRLAQFKDTTYMNRVMQQAAMQAVAPRQPVKETDKGLTGAVKWYEISYQPEGWHNFWLPGYWADQGVKGLNGVVWFRKEVEVPASMAGKPAKLFVGRIVDADETYVNGVKVGNITYQYPPRRYDVPAGLLKTGKNLIVVRITNTFGKGGFVPDKRYELTGGNTHIDIRGDWQYKVGQVYAPRRVSMGDRESGYAVSAQNEPAGLYNTMVAPAIQYTIKGFVWYQGETNTGNAKEYANLLPALIADWRSKWQQGSLPFLLVQLPNFMEVQYSPSESQWAELREAQLKALSVPNTAMAVAIDAGEWNDIHPLDKKDVGNRLALAAEHIAYHDSKVVGSGPIYQSAKVEGNKIIISFNSIGGGLMVKGGGALQQFAIAGTDKHFVWADAKIEGDKVIVSSPEVTNPMYVRYAWADNPEGANLYNKEGLPASPFRTDNP